MGWEIELIHALIHETILTFCLSFIVRVKLNACDALLKFLVN